MPRAELWIWGTSSRSLLSLVPHQHKMQRAAVEFFKEYQQQPGTEVKEQNETEIEICPLRFYCWLVWEILPWAQKYERPLNEISLRIEVLVARGNLVYLGGDLRYYNWVLKCVNYSLSHPSTQPLPGKFWSSIGPPNPAGFEVKHGRDVPFSLSENPN